jgi:hypothetical protein
MAIALATAALAAALVKVLEDVSPGGHHTVPSVLLANNQRAPSSWRFYRRHVSSKASQLLLANIMNNQFLRLAIIVGGATAFALVEAALSSGGSNKIGAHHGVLFIFSSLETSRWKWLVLLLLPRQSTS